MATQSNLGKLAILLNCHLPIRVRELKSLVKRRRKNLHIYFSFTAIIENLVMANIILDCPDVIFCPHISSHDHFIRHMLSKIPETITVR